MGGSAVPDWLSDLVGPGAAAPTAPGQFLPQGIAKPLEIPQALVAGLTANNNAIIQRVSAQTGAQIILRQDTRNFGYSLALFSGPQAATFKAREQLAVHCGLTKGQNTTRTIELLSQNSTAFAALRQVVPGIMAKHGMMPIKLLAPDRPGMPFKAQIGPGQLAHVVTVESAVRRALRDIELDIYSRAGRRVPAEIKYAMMCKNTIDGIQCPNIGCQFCHTEAELEIASRCLWENVTKPSELSGHDQPLALSLTPTELKSIGDAPKKKDIEIKKSPPRESSSSGATSGLL